MKPAEEAEKAMRHGPAYGPEARRVEVLGEALTDAWNRALDEALEEVAALPDVVRRISALKIPHNDKEAP